MYWKWIGIILVKLIAWPYSLIVWPVAYVYRKEVRKSMKRGVSLLRPSFWLWITLDDEEDYGEDWWLIDHKLKKTMLTSWRWSWARNNSWNLNQILRLKTVNEKVVAGYDTSKLNNPLLHCRFKWEIERVGNYPIDGWHVNSGTRLSETYTNMGKAFAIYIDALDEDSKPLWRSSYAGIKWGWMINYKLGFNNLGEALIDLKIKKFKPYYMAHWK